MHWIRRRNAVLAGQGNYGVNLRYVPVLDLRV